MSYLLSQLWLCLLLAALIGGIIGWLLRGGCRNKLAALETSYHHRIAELERERDALSAQVSDYDTLSSERDSLSRKLSALSLVENERDDLQARLAALDSDEVADDEDAPTVIFTTENRIAEGGEVAPSAAASSYDVEDIEGIGPGYGKRLRGIDIATTTDLLNACGNQQGLDEVAAKIDMESDVVRSWTCMADLMRVNGVDGQYAELLEFSNVHDVATLSKADPDGLTVKMEDTNEREHRVKHLPTVEIVRSWISHAGTLPAMLSSEISTHTALDGDMVYDTTSLSDSQIAAAIDTESSYEIEEIEGIGKGYGKKLREMGIATTADLLNKCPDTTSMQPLVDMMKLEDWVIHSWVTMADLMRVNGIGGQYAELLNFSEIRNVEALARANASGLVAKMNKVNDQEHRVKTVPDAETVTGWIEHAKTLPEMFKA